MIVGRYSATLLWVVENAQDAVLAEGEAHIHLSLMRNAGREEVATWAQPVGNSWRLVLRYVHACMSA